MSVEIPRLVPARCCKGRILIEKMVPLVNADLLRLYMIKILAKHEELAPKQSNGCGPMKWKFGHRGTRAEEEHKMCECEECAAQNCKLENWLNRTPERAIEYTTKAGPYQCYFCFGKVTMLQAMKKKV